MLAISIPEGPESIRIVAVEPGTEGFYEYAFGGDAGIKYNVTIYGERNVSFELAEGDSKILEYFNPYRVKVEWDGYSIEKNVTLCNNNGICEPCSGTCEVSENSLSCGDCRGKPDRYCLNLSDGFCDPDCERDPDCDRQPQIPWVVMLVIVFTGLIGWVLMAIRKG